MALITFNPSEVPSKIGSVVVLQVFSRDRKEPGNIVPDSLAKYIGKLEGVRFSKKRASFNIGRCVVHVDHDAEYYELYENVNG